MSGRIRSIKPELLEDTKTSSLSDKEFRLFVSSFLLADDYGNFRAHPGLVHGAVYWALLDEAAKETARALARLSEVGLIKPYVVREQTYATITNWTKHQKVDHPGKPRVPGPSEGISVSLATPSRESAESLAPDLRSPISDHRPGPPTEPDGSTHVPNDPGSSKRTEEEPSLEPSLESKTVTPKPAPKATQNGPQKLATPEPKAAVPHSREQQVFEHYLAGWKRFSRGTRAPKLDPKRLGKIRARLAEGYTVDDLKLAVDGLWCSTWHIEHRQIDIELVCRDAPHVDRFLSEAPSPPKVNTTRADDPADDDPILTPEQLRAAVAEHTNGVNAPLFQRFTGADPGSDIRLKTPVPTAQGGSK